MRRILLALTLAGLAHGAPAPKQPATRIQPGHYTQTWHGSPWNATFQADGVVTFQAGQSLWSGAWTWDDASRTLSVREYKVNDDGTLALTGYRWSITLDSRLSGLARVQGTRCTFTVPMTFRKR